MKSQDVEYQYIYHFGDLRSAQIAPQASGPGYRELARLVASWGRLPDSRKRAILARYRGRGFGSRQNWRQERSIEETVREIEEV